MLIELLVKRGVNSIGALLLLLVGTLDLRANVSLKNGNFFVVYTDIVYPGGFQPKIERVYNSKSPFKGMFGLGWGNEYDVYLEPQADGSVMLHEYRAGASNRFEAPTIANLDALTSPDP